MAYKDDLEVWRRYSEKNQIAPGYAKPPIDNVLIRLGFEKPPMIFWPFPVIALVLGVVFALCWGLIMDLSVWNYDAKMDLQSKLTASVCAGLAFGAFVGVSLRRRRRKLGLGSWSSFLKENA